MFVRADPEWIANVHVNLRATERQAAELSAAHPPADSQYATYTRLQWALKVLSLIDLTTLAGDDTRSNVQRLCQQAAHPLATDVQKKIHELTTLHGEKADAVHTAAVCVYPSRVSDAHQMLDRMSCIGRIQIAAVATGFPTGQYGIESRLAEIHYAISAGATEIDIVLDRSLVLTGKWNELHSELLRMRHACGERVHLKTILAIGECGSMENVYRAAMVSMMAGADFIKTSTGKEAVNATLLVGLVMIRAIEEFRRRTGTQRRCIGLKPAGGVRTLDEAVAWLCLLVNTLGDHWLCAQRFRFGASGLLDNVIEVVRKEMPAVSMTMAGIGTQMMINNSVPVTICGPDVSGY